MPSISFYKIKKMWVGTQYWLRRRIDKLVSILYSKISVIWFSKTDTTKYLPMLQFIKLYIRYLYFVAKFYHSDAFSKCVNPAFYNWIFSNFHIMTLPINISSLTEIEIWKFSKTCRLITTNAKKKSIPTCWLVSLLLKYREKNIDNYSIDTSEYRISIHKATTDILGHYKLWFTIIRILQVNIRSVCSVQSLEFSCRV